MVCGFSNPKKRRVLRTPPCLCLSKASAPSQNTVNIIMKLCLELVRYLNDRLDEIFYWLSFSFISSFLGETIKILKKILEISLGYAETV